MIECQVYGGPLDGLEIYLDDEEGDGVGYWIETPRFTGITQNPDGLIARLKMINVSVWVMTPKQRGDIIILDFFERVLREPA